jgi:hypothetical protein
MHINYANALVFRYHYHYLESLATLLKPPKEVNNPPSSIPTLPNKQQQLQHQKDEKEKEFTDFLNITGADVPMQIYVPEPFTSDDDSDPGGDNNNNDQDEDDPEDSNLSAVTPKGTHTSPSSGTTGGERSRRFTQGVYYRIIKTRTASSPGSRSPYKSNDEPSPLPGSPTKHASSGSQMNMTSAGPDSDDDEKHSEISEDLMDVWSQQLNDKFSSIASFFFECRIYFFEEIDLMVLIHDYKVISIMKISKCMEKDKLKNMMGKSQLLPKKHALKIINRPPAAPAPSSKRDMNPQRKLSIRGGNSSASMRMSKDGRPMTTGGLLLSASGALSSKLYALDSEDDEDDNNSDRDYQEDEDYQQYLGSPTKVESLSSSVSSGGSSAGPTLSLIKLLSYDG